MHFSTERWSDFVRGVVPEQLAARMQSHLSTGCGRCSRTANLLRRVAKVGAEPEIQVPASVIHKAKAIYSIPRKHSVTAIVARIVFDSFSEPLPAGVRSRTRIFRHAMFEAGDMLVDVQLQNQPDGKFLVTGQVADKSAPTRSSSRLMLHLVSGSQRLELQANRFGEFQTIYDATQEIRLEVKGYGRCIEVPLFQVADGQRNDGAAVIDRILPE